MFTDFWYFQKATMPTPIVDRSIVPFRFLVALIATGTSALKVAIILVALKTTINRNANSHCRQNFGNSKSYLVNSDS